MDVNELIDALDLQGALLHDAATRSGAAAPVPSCPGWSVADLLRHVGEVHRWAAAIVRDGALEDLDSVALVGGLPPDDGLADWVAAGHRALVDTLRAAPADLVCWYFMPAASPLAFWSRRQLHETSVHRMDAELAAGTALTPVTDAVAADGVDELLTSFLPRRSTRLRSEHPRTLLVAPTDSPLRWSVRITQDQPETVREEHPADAVLRGPVGLVYPLLWNRLGLDADGLEVVGDAGLLDLWRTMVTVSWS